VTPVSCEPVSAPDSLLTGKNTGNRRNFRTLKNDSGLGYRHNSGHFQGDFPAHRNREFLRTNREVLGQNRVVRRASPTTLSLRRRSHFHGRGDTRRPYRGTVMPRLLLSLPLLLSLGGASIIGRHNGARPSRTPLRHDPSRIRPVRAGSTRTGGASQPLLWSWDGSALAATSLAPNLCNDSQPRGRPSP
jgi:hypothetical protein